MKHAIWRKELGGRWLDLDLFQAIEAHVQVMVSEEKGSGLTLLSSQSQQNSILISVQMNIQDPGLSQTFPRSCLQGRLF